MKTIKLSRFLLSSVLFLSVFSLTASAEGMKCGASMKTPKIKEESTKWNPKKYDANKVTPKVYEKQEWLKQDSQAEYQRGTIGTH